MELIFIYISVSRVPDILFELLVGATLLKHVATSFLGSLELDPGKNIKLKPILLESAVSCRQRPEPDLNLSIWGHMEPWHATTRLCAVSSCRTCRYPDGCMRLPSVPASEEQQPPRVHPLPGSLGFGSPGSRPGSRPLPPPRRRKPHRHPRPSHHQHNRRPWRASGSGD